MSAIEMTSTNWDDSEEIEFNEAELQQLLDGSSNNASSTVVGLQQADDGFDSNTGNTWIYPSNLPQRAYQYSITQAALYRNTLVVLPTGLGKTFIAAVVMYNLYRWYPTGKLIFMAPTRPLVAQQIAACQKIMPIPVSDRIELTGKLTKPKRAELWRTKRVFFATPQVVQSDIFSDVTGTGDIIFPFKDIKLLVFDEAHKARGRYAYVEVAQHIVARNRNIRVMALSATPGRTMDDVAEVCRNLFISNLEVRWDTSIDVLPYVHQRSMKTIVVPLGEEIRALRDRLLEIIDPYMRQLVAADVLRSGSALSQFNRNYLVFEQKRFIERSQHERHPQHATIMSNFSVCISLYHALELLERHGLRVFVNNFDTDEDGRDKFILTMDSKLRALVDEIKKQLGPNPFDVSATAMTNGKLPPMPAQLDFGHPKYEHARQCVLQHFETHVESRAIVFCEYRESVMLIYRLLLQHTPLLRPRCFVGQGGTGAIRALTQKQQIQIMQDFRSGKSNILIATSIGEEGIDVGEVELIVCFDISTSNPTRFIQRIGRTGRQKNGNVIMLVTEGREQQLLKDVLVNREHTNKKLLNSSIVKQALYPHAPRLVPAEFNPKCEMTLMQPLASPPPAEDSNLEPKKKGTRATKKSTKQLVEAKGSQDLRKFFHKAPQRAAPNLDAEEYDIFDVSNSSSTAAALPAALSTQTQRQLKQRSSLLTSLFDTTQAATNVANPPDVRPAKPDTLHLRRIQKLLQTQKPLLTEAQRKFDLRNQLTSKQLSQRSKLLLLRHQPDFVHKLVMQMEVLQALEGDGNAMCQEEQEIREIHKLCIELFGDDATLRQAAVSIPALIEHDAGSSKALEAAQEEQQYEAACADIFAGLDEQGFCYDNFEFIQEQLAAIEQQKANLSIRQQPEQCKDAVGESMVYDSFVATTTTTDTAENLDCTEVTHYTLAESKYQSQWFEFSKDEIRQSSTPVPQRKRSKIHVDQAIESESQKEVKPSEVENIKGEYKESVACHRPVSPPVPSFNDSTNSTKSQLDLSHLGVVTAAQLLERQLDVAAASTPLAAKSKTKVQPHDAKEFLHELDNDVEAFMMEINVEQQTDDKLSATPDKRKQDMLSELVLDMADFLEPLPEEQELLSQTKLTPSPASSKENHNYNTNVLALPPILPGVAKRVSPDIFDETITPVKSVAPLKVNESAPLVKSNSLTTKLVAKCKMVRPQPMPSSPQQRATIDKSKHEKSPSVFDMYLTNTRGRVRLPKTMEGSALNHTSKDSPILRRKRSGVKRKIIDSESDDDQHSARILENSENDSDFEEQIPATQMLKDSPSLSHQQQRFKRRKLNSFIDSEAAGDSNDDNHDDDDENAEYTVGGYLKDSVIVSSDENEVEDHEAVQALYLQAARSPAQQRGAFKIPAPRVYNDQSHIFSQTLPHDELESSQYLPNSFVVANEEEDASCLVRESRDISMCPLERAERILKERRRKKRRAKLRGSKEEEEQQQPQRRKRRRVIQRIGASSSSDEDVILVE